jgi:tetratricopeptide (TPR) repeat protein
VSETTIIDGKKGGAGGDDARTGEKWFQRAMEWYEMYLDNGEEVRETRKKLKNFEPLSAMSEGYYKKDKIDPVGKLKREEERLGKLGKALLKECEKCFKEAFRVFEWTYGGEKGRENSVECGEILCAWGDAVYALAIIKVNRAFYKDAKKYFNEAIRLYKEVENGGKKDVGILRRLGKAYYEVAAINMRSSLFDEAEKSFRETLKRFEILKKQEKIEPADRRVLGETYFELGRVAWERYLFWIEGKDGTFVKALEDESTGALLGGVDSLALDSQGYLVFREAEEINRPLGGQLSESNDKLKSYGKCGEDCFGKAEGCYFAPGYEVNDRDRRNLGEMYSIRGRVHRYLYLLYRYWQRAGKEQVTVEGERIGSWDEEIDRNVKKAKENFSKSIEYFAASYKKYGEDGKEKRDAVWNILGAAYFRLYLTYRFDNKVDEKELKENALNRAREFFEKTECGILRILVSLSTDVGYPLVNSGELFNVLRFEGEENKDAVFFNTIVKGGKTKEVLETEAVNHTAENSAGRLGETGGGGGESVKTRFREMVRGVVGKRENFGGASDLNRYMEIYVRSMYVISRLEINCEYVKKIAHYKKRDFARAMLFDGEHLRLYSENSFNDPKEGRLLLDCCLLGDAAGVKSDDDALEEEINSGFLNFAGCFSFNYDCLNQFRLYGTEGDTEGTGLSLVFNRSFFKEELRQNFVADFNDLENTLCKNREDKEESKKWLEGLQVNCEKSRPERPWSPLFRCAYLDPETELVDTVGQKERYLFFREGAVKDYWVYKSYVNQIIRDVNVELLKMRVLATGLDRKILERLLVQLRYLVKHVAFKVEQECRVVKNRNLDMDAEEIKNDQSNRFNLFIEYEPRVAQHIEEVYFGPTAKGIDVFVDNLKLHDLRDVKCLKSKNPLSEDLNPKGVGCPLR